MSPIDGNKLRELRTARGLTQKQLAELADIYQPRVAELENGVPRQTSVDVLQRLAAALGCALDDLVKPLPPRRGRR